MVADNLHTAALIATARLELDHAHRAILAAEAGELRRGLQMTLDALTEAAAAERDTDAAPPLETIAAVRQTVAQALADLDQGALGDLATRIEEARRELSEAG